MEQMTLANMSVLFKKPEICSYMRAYFNDPTGDYVVINDILDDLEIGKFVYDEHFDEQIERIMKTYNTCYLNGYLPESWFDI